MRVVIPVLEPWHLRMWKKWEVDRDEMWEGVLHMPPAPNTMHQDFEGQLYAHVLYEWAKPRGCRVFQQINLTYPNEPDWTQNYRIPDILLLTPDRFGTDRGTHFAGAPLVVVEIRSGSDETYDKFPFYAGLGVPEVWVFDRDTKEPEVHELAGTTYRRRATAADGWLRSPASGVEFRHERPGAVRARVAGDDATAAELPEG